MQSPQKVSAVTSGMVEPWQSYNNAPDIGVRICSLTDVPDGSTFCLELNGYPIVMVRFDQDVRAYVNACPHQYLPLDYKGKRLLSADKQTLRCTSHGAGFSAMTGEGIEGLGVGSCLDPIPVSVVGGAIYIGPSLSAEH